MSSRTKPTLLGTVATWIAVVPTGAFAQSAEDSEAAAEEAGNPTIVVTAQKREEDKL